MDRGIYTGALHPEQGCRFCQPQSLRSYSTQIGALAKQPCVLGKGSATLTYWL